MSLNFRGIPCLIGAFLVLVSCATPQAVPLTRSQIETEIVGHSFRYEGFENKAFLFSGRLNVMADGKLVFETDSGAPESGSWRIDGNTACFALDNSRNGAENCVGISRLGQGKYLTSEGYFLNRI